MSSYVVQKASGCYIALVSPDGSSYRGECFERLNDMSDGFLILRVDGGILYVGRGKIILVDNVLAVHIASQSIHTLVCERDGVVFDIASHPVDHGWYGERPPLKSVEYEEVPRDYLDATEHRKKHDWKITLEEGLVHLIRIGIREVRSSFEKG